MAAIMSSTEASPVPMNRFRGNGPSGLGEGSPWPVDAVPASFAVRRSYTPPRNTPPRIRSTRCFGTPSKSNGAPSVVGAVPSSQMSTAGAATVWPSLPEKHERPSSSARPPNPIQARNPTSVAVAAGSSTTV